MSASGWGGVIIAVILVFLFSAVYYGVMPRAGSDIYGWAKKNIPTLFRKKVKSESGENATETLGESQEAGKPDWSKKKASWEFIKWVLIFPVLMFCIQIPELFLRPVLWNTMEALIYGFIACINIYSLLVIHAFELLMPDGKNKIWGKHGKRRRRTKQLMVIGAIVLTMIMLSDSLRERSIYKRIAQDYCLTDLPGFIDKWLVSNRSGVPISEVDERQLREIMRSPLVSVHMSSGSCKE